MVFAYPRAALGSTQRVFVSENFLQDGWPGASRDLDEFIVWSVSAMVSALQVVEVIPPWWREARWLFAIVENPYWEIFSTLFIELASMSIGYVEYYGSMVLE